MSSAPVITARAVVKRWGHTMALAGATVDVPGGVTGLLGSNGAGKTTLLGLVLGLHRPDDGSLSVLGLDPATAGPEVRARVGYAPEHHNLPPDLAAHDFVRHIAEVHGLPRRAATARASDALWQVGLGEERLRPIGTMSTGQRQRVKLAQAIAHDPALVLLDEPTDGLDPVQRDDMLALIRRIGRDYGIHVVLSSHLLEEVERVCDNVVILSTGSVVAAGPLDELRSGGEGLILELVDRHQEVTAALAAAGLTVTPVGRRLEITGSADIDRLSDLVRDAVVAQGAGIRRMHARRMTLEDVFLEIGEAEQLTSTGAGA